MELEVIKKALENGGIEIYQHSAQQIQIAERVRYHMMDSGVRVCANPSGFEISFLARAQRSDFGAMSDEELFERVEQRMGRIAQEHGFVERLRQTTHAYDPVDRSKVLDTWYEISFVLIHNDLQRLVDEVRWAVALDKVVAG